MTLENELTRLNRGTTSIYVQKLDEHYTLLQEKIGNTQGVRVDDEPKRAAIQSFAEASLAEKARRLQQLDMAIRGLKGQGNRPRRR